MARSPGRVAKVTAEIWIDVDALMRQPDLGWDVTVDAPLSDVHYLVTQAVDSLTALAGLRIKTRYVAVLPAGALSNHEEMT